MAAGVARRRGRFRCERILAATPALFVSAAGVARRRGRFRCERILAAAPALFVSVAGVARRCGGFRCGRGLAAAAALLAAAATSAEAQGSRRPQARLTDFYEQWFAEVEPLFFDHERRAFEQLEGPGAQERFLRAFWAARPPRLLERWRQNLEARDQLRERSPEMERAVLLAGKPAYRQSVEPCESTLAANRDLGL